MGNGDSRELFDEARKTKKRSEKIYDAAVKPLRDAFSAASDAKGLYEQLMLPASVVRQHHVWRYEEIVRDNVLELDRMLETLERYSTTFLADTLAGVFDEATAKRLTSFAADLVDEDDQKLYGRINDRIKTFIQDCVDAGCTRTLVAKYLTCAFALHLARMSVDVLSVLRDPRAPTSLKFVWSISSRSTESCHQHAMNQARRCDELAAFMNKNKEGVRLLVKRLTNFSVAMMAFRTHGTAVIRVVGGGTHGETPPRLPK